MSGAEVIKVKMKLFSFFAPLVMLVIICSLIPNSTQLNAVLKSWGSCGGKKYPTFLHIFNFKHLGDYVHRVDVNLTGSVDLGANLKYRTNVYKNNKKIPVNFSGKDVCKGCQGILGEVMATVVREFTPKTENSCPIKKGVYTARKVEIDVKQIKLPIPLKGEFRVEVPVQEISSNKEITCVEIAAELF